MPKLILLATLSIATTAVQAEAVGTYIANAGVMVRNGDTVVLFDPLFRNSYGLYQLPTTDIERQLIAGTPPYDGVDAIFISHHHGDHFSAPDLLRFMEAHVKTVVYAPMQAAESLLYLVDDADVAARITGIDIDYGDAAVTIDTDDIRVAALAVPHSGWPDSMTDVQNIAYRVTLDDSVTVMHMGDADTRQRHYGTDNPLWAERQIDAAFPPYWYFMSGEGRLILDELLDVELAVGVHVPVELDADTTRRLQGHDLFRTPGETRSLAPSNE